MAKVDLIMPKMGESIMEATILNWTKKIGDSIAMDETVLEIATDKVDSEIPSPVEGVLAEILFKEGDVVAIGKVIARIESDVAVQVDSTPDLPSVEKVEEPKISEEVSLVHEVVDAPSPVITKVPEQVVISSSRFYSPLVKSIAKAENISIAELDSVAGSGANGRLTKKDMLAYLENRTSMGSNISIPSLPIEAIPPITSSKATPVYQSSGANEIIEMDRMRKLIADHMVKSVQTAPHVTSFIEADVTNLVNWRNSNKDAFLKKYGQKITFTPIIIEAVVKAIKDFPLINVSLDGTKIIVKKNINIGMAAALPTGNLIVPVIKNADRYSLSGLAESVNDLAQRARTNKLKPDDIQGGTFTLTNVGTFGNVMGTPIINQPQVAILAAGVIRKRPAVLETEDGDVIAIRQMMFLSLSYDHRVVDGFLGGSFVRKVGDYLEQFDHKQKI